MTNHTNEANLIAQELELLTEVDGLRAKIATSRRERRSHAGDGDAETITEAQEAYDEAEAKVARLEAEKKAAETGKRALDTRLSGGDESVSLDDIVSADKAVARLATLLEPAKRDLQKAERVLAPMLADLHLAHLAADLLESVTDVPVIIRRKVSNAPEVTPSVVLSQVEPTDAYGTLEASGAVKVTEVGDTGIDWRAVKVAFEDAGCEGRVTNTQIVFDKAWWPTPRLHEPSKHGIGSWMHAFEEAWGLQVSGAAEAQRLRDHGYDARVKSVWAGLFDRPSTDLTFEDGKAVGTATFRIAAQRENGVSMDVPDLEAELTELFGVFREETVGDITEAGEIVSVSLSDLKPVNVEWSKSAVAWRMGGAVQPFTAEAIVTIEFAYEEAR